MRTHHTQNGIALALRYANRCCVISVPHDGSFLDKVGHAACKRSMFYKKKTKSNAYRTSRTSHTVTLNPLIALLAIVPFIIAISISGKGVRKGVKVEEKMGTMSSSMQKRGLLCVLKRFTPSFVLVISLSIGQTFMGP